MKKKIAIITSHHYPNYGNKLQNYALQTILQHIGCDVETIHDSRPFANVLSIKYQKKNLLHFFIRIRTTPRHLLFAKFYFFSKYYLKYSKTIVCNDSDLANLKYQYDYFVVGADQIWNPEWSWFSNDFGFAAFADKNQKIAYAPSMGISEMIYDREEEYRKYLKDWKALSCREYEGSKIIEQLTGLTIPTMPDPTLLLTSSEWKRLARYPIKNKRYALFYRIGLLENDYKEYVDNFKLKKGIDVIELNSENYNQGYGPREFLGLVCNAEYMITDSFHGCVFALQFHIPIILFQRIQPNEKDKLSRIRTLYSFVGISTDFKRINEYINLDWTKIDQAFTRKRQKGIQYLTDNIE